jgi:3,4-dihydroxy 2-butanone 4-phosphate synthase
MYMAGVKPSATICEMMGDDGGSRTKESVAEFAAGHGISMIDGTTVIAEWEKFLERTGLDV